MPEPVEPIVVTSPVPPPVPNPDDDGAPGTTALPGSASAVAVELYFYTISDLHRTFFSDPRPVAKLGTALGTCLNDTAQVVISWDAEERIGRIYLKVPPDALECLPVEGDGGFDLEPLAAVGKALAAYRDAVAGNYDYRVASFRIGASFTRGAKSCTMWASGSHPPDGTAWSPCIALHDREACAGDGDEAVKRWVAPDTASAKYVRDCFRR